VEEGSMQRNNANVVLDSCASAIAAGDGRELWYSNEQSQLVSAQSSPPKCATLQDGSLDKGGKIVLTSCAEALEHSDGRSSWSFESNSQVRLQRAGAYCLFQTYLFGSTAGLGDVIAELKPATECTSVSDDSHSPSKAIDQNSDTFWASGAFPDDKEHYVRFNINLGEEIKVARLKIDWEYQPLSYSISRSVDGQSCE
ncbi:F5/8 type C domain-containing protein, partial [Cardiosporidium cionae]